MFLARLSLSLSLGWLYSGSAPSVSSFPFSSRVHFTYIYMCVCMYTMEERGWGCLIHFAYNLLTLRDIYLKFHPRFLLSPFIPVPFVYWCTCIGGYTLDLCTNKCIIFFFFFNTSIDNVYKKLLVEIFLYKHASEYEFLAKIFHDMPKFY